MTEGRHSHTLAPAVALLVVVVAVAAGVGPDAVTAETPTLRCADGDTGVGYGTDAGLAASDDAPPAAVTNPLVDARTLRIGNTTLRLRGTGTAATVVETAAPDVVCLGATATTNASLTVAPDAAASLTLSGALDGLRYGPVDYAAGGADLRYDAPTAVTVTVGVAPANGTGTAVRAVDAGTGATLATATADDGAVTLVLPAGSHGVDLRADGGSDDGSNVTGLAVAVAPDVALANRSSDVVVTVRNATDGTAVPDATVTLSGPGVSAAATAGATGTVRLPITADAAGTVTVAVVTPGGERATATLPVRSGVDNPVVVGDRPALDVDGDGRLEDVNGDGTFGLDDVIDLLFADRSETVRSAGASFDFDGRDGTVGFDDVVALLFESLA